MRTPEESRRISRTFIDTVFNRRDLAGADELVADPFVEHNPLAPDMGNGRAAALATFEAILAMTPDLRVDVHEIVATGDRVAIRATYAGTDSGTGWGAALGKSATGAKFSVEGIDVAIIDDDGRFREHYGLFDVPGMLGQLGLMPG
jgi:steroid delta-isomerase-like uncharacterized protein